MVLEAPVGGQQEGQGEHKNLTRPADPFEVGGFEGVCLTTVILAPGACSLLRPALSPSHGRRKAGFCVEESCAL